MAHEYTNIEEISKLDFPYPMQVIFEWAFEDEEAPSRHGGVAYRDKIVCGCCGGVFEIPECTYIKPLNWIDISDCITGDEI